jgi:FkbM family methyltransferase
MKIPVLLKKVLKKTFFREGTVKTVLWGPCRGLRYRIFADYGWAYLYGGSERPVVRAMQRLIMPGSTVYDLGANYGMHTLLFSRLVGDRGHVYAFEPNPEIFAALQEHLALNSIQCVTCVRKAVASETGEAYFDVGHNRAAGHLTNFAHATYKVQTTSIDDFVFVERERPPTFLKVDVEGAESSALQGALNVIRQYRPTMVIELHTPDEDRRVGAILQAMNYSAFRVTTGARVENLSSGWPDPNGLWGTVCCLPLSA